METFDSTKTSLYDILKDVKVGTIQLPDFQRGWIWDDFRIRGLIASIAKSFPIGAIMLLETGNPQVRFKNRPVEGAVVDPDTVPERLILDGQQRITSLFQAIITNKVVKTRNERGYAINRWYYIDMKKALDDNYDLEEAILSINEDKIIKEDFGRKVVLDLSKPEYEYQHLIYPVWLIDEYHEWRREFNNYWNHDPEKTRFWDQFEKEIISNFNNYMLPVINMKRRNTKEAICQVFEKVNTGGVSLTVFELLTATFAADNFDLREDWSQRKERLYKYEVLTKTSATDLIQSITLLSTFLKRLSDMKQRKPEDQWSAVSCKRKDMLNLTLDEYRSYVDRIEQGFIKSAKLLFENKIFQARDIPYTSQLVPLAAFFAANDNRDLSITEKDKLMKWYWCGVLGELYGGGNETRFALDLPQVSKYIFDNGTEPKTIYDASFSPSRLHTLRTRNSAAYKGIYAILLKDGAMDFITGSTIEHSTYFEEAIDIHHIFPKSWCEKKHIPKTDYDCIINKTPLSASTNRIIGGNSPSDYLQSIMIKHELSEERLNTILRSHIIDMELLFSNQFDAFFQKRKAELLDRIEQAMGKEIPRDQKEIENEYLGNGYEYNL